MKVARRTVSGAGKRAGGWWPTLQAASLFLAVVVAGAYRVGAESASGSGLPDFSAWFRFESGESLSRSTGITPWPAMTRDVLWLPPGKGRSGGAVHLPGRPGNGLYLPNPAAFFGERARAGTIALWVRTAEPPGAKPRILFDFMVSTGNTLVDGYETVMFVQEGALVAWPALGRRMTIQNPLAGGKWVHLALAWNCASGTALYVNGRKAAERSGRFRPTPLSSRWPGRIGCHTVSGGYPFSGDIDELRLFNRRLNDQEIAEIAALDPTPPPLDVEFDGRGNLRITNHGRRGAAVQIDRWLPGREAAPPWYDWTPADFNRTVWSAGNVPAEPDGVGFVIRPGDTASRAVRFPGDYLGPGRLRVMAGDGWGRQELPVRRQRTFRLSHLWRRGDSVARFGLLDRRGLVVEVLRSKPLVLPDSADAILPIRIENDTARRVRGGMVFTITDAAGTPCAEVRTSLDLRPGRGRESTAVFQGFRPARCRYVLSADFAPSNAKRRVPLLRLPLFGCGAQGLGHLCAVGAAYVGNPTDEKVLRRMAEDGVDVVRFAPKKDGNSFRHALEDVLAHGLRVWHTPVFSYRQVCADPAKRAEVRRWAAELGEGLRDNIAVVHQSMAGEGLSYPPCYCDHCTRAFRAYLRRKYGTIARLNRAWGSHFRAWKEIEQIGSPADVDMAAERLKMMQVALELPKNNVERWKRLFELDRPRAMDWKRWHDDLLLAWYRDFSDAFHKTNGGAVPLGEQPCWPNFKPHVFFPLAEIADAGGMDLYLPGEMKTTLGYAAELFLNFDMNASLYTNLGKPVMVHELYVQDLSPPGLARAQGWWLIGRGYGVMTYFTYNYYHEGTRAGLPLIFGLFDKDWRPYPVCPSFRRFVRELGAFRKRFDFSSLRRCEPRVGLFLGDDVSIANVLESGGATWEAAGVKGHNGSYWLTERNGYAVEFVNDTGFRFLDRERVLIVPWCHVIREQSVRSILRFARRGGTVIIDGPFALYNEVYRPYGSVPGGGAAKVLGVWCSDCDAGASASITVGGGETLRARGRFKTVQLAPGATIRGRYPDGTPAIVERAVGRGRVVWLLSALGPEYRSRAPGIEALRFWGRLLAAAGVHPRWRFVRREAGEAAAGGGVTDGKPRSGRPADSAPLTDVSLRIRKDRELFVFAVNFFAPSCGDLRIALPSGRFLIDDVCTGERPACSRDGEDLVIPLRFDSFDARVFRIVPAESGGRPFVDW